MEYNVIYDDLEGTPEVVSLAVAKNNSNIADSFIDDDALLQLILDAAIQEAENYIETPIQHRNMVIELSEWPGIFEMPLYPITGITGIVYKDVDGQDQTVSASDYFLYSMDGRNKIKFTWDSSPSLSGSEVFPIKINCRAGYATDDMPGPIKSAVLLRFSHRERFREDVPTSYNRSFYAALRPYRLWK